MRKNQFVLLAAALLVVTGCKKDDNAAVNDNGAKMTFTATIDNGGSKTTIDDHDMKWAKGDVVNINGKDFTADEAGESTTFTGDEVEKKDGKYKAYYLVAIGEDGSLSLPDGQTRAGADLAGVNPMYAESEDLTLTFHNICALIKLDLKGTGSVKTITASANRPLKGTFEVLQNQDGGYYAHATSTAEADKSVVLNCGDGVELNGTNATTFYIALPQGEYTGLKFTLSDGTYTYPIEISGTKELTAGIMYAKEVTGVVFVAPVPDGALKGKFTVDKNGKQVYFSKGNLQATYHSDNKGGYYTWDFAANQYEIVGNKAGNISIGSQKNGDVVDLFCWSTKATNSNYGIHIKTSHTAGYTDGDFKDWGDAYCESNNLPSKTCYTLSGGENKEWDYLINGRTGDYAPEIGDKIDCRCARVKVKGRDGLLVFPDKFVWPEEVETKPTSFNSFSSSTATYDAEVFQYLEKAGAVFLPAAGYRSGNSINEIAEVGSTIRGRYQSSTPNGYNAAYNLYLINNGNFGGKNSNYRYFGFSVRLVSDVK